MHVGRDYVSWWPEGHSGECTLPGSEGRIVPVCCACEVHGQSFRDDQDFEGAPPDHTVALDGLDATPILAWWSEFDRPGRAWNTFGQNCATTVGRALMVGGGDDYALGGAGWSHSWNMSWRPGDVLRYAQEIQHGLAVRHERQAAIHFVRHFTTARFDLPSLTTHIDKNGLARALQRELARNSGLVARVFRELGEWRNDTADGVAEVYVQLLSTDRGAPLAAVASDPPLKDLLVRLLSRGRTSESKKKSLAFLAALN
jgi:hypothetical protein